MKNKILIGTIAALVLSFLDFVSGQESFSFKLYMESLANGKKDTLELGISPNGCTGCDYDSSLCSPVFYPFDDTIAHIGAFAVTGEPQYFDYEYNGNNFDTNYDPPLECPVFLKKRIVPLRYDMVIVFPASAVPIRLSWDSVLLSDPTVASPVLTDLRPSLRWDIIDIGSNYKEWMSECSSFTIGGYGWGWSGVPALTSIYDSAGNRHRYQYCFIQLGLDRTATNEIEKECPNVIKIIPNPVTESFTFYSDMTLQTWRVFNIAGQIIASGAGSQSQVDCHGWNKGLYIFEGISPQMQKYHVKFIKR
ncbi:MAG: T9SS type A sorting domain-containing protein [Bacteroidetes bacterium]|uniref:T9SS type A sorting domain-containing protein n=1 Tax=Candidatus Pullibacteroides excrementavium TaxID=2840905 RepID=A0A9D9H1Y5_9BACT|nr:T9SS type A sorting domain-containing protein [Candidatus Pullibacteroides excrementavium]